jgi:N6-L-threonylcarbamoyladenine synthase
MLTLAFETSCDETSAAVVDGDLKVLSNIVASQIEIHRRFGGVVPEVASRNHLLSIESVTQEALQRAGVSVGRITQTAATTHPGLAGAVMVGRVFAESLAAARNLPFIGVNHAAGHIASCMLSNPGLRPPFRALVVSGGHTSIYKVQSSKSVKLVSSTTDDACGEAFDKVAKVLGLPYPGGPEISRLASQFNGETDLVFMPNANYKKSKDFSYSGLKTAVLNYVNRKRQAGEILNLPEICFAFQREAIGQLVTKCNLAGQDLPLAVCGGVAANAYLRTQFPDAYFPDAGLCGDNAAMIGAAAILFDKNLLIS